ncbi:MAG TPA: hypothetical protein VI566_10925 [Xanthomonadales bacterium]|nr:hypothetical protein [Xanthomonadales bacterium]
MNKFLTFLLVVNSSLAAAASNEATPPDSDDSITIYSRMQPGAVSPEWYRPSGGVQAGGNVPGYAIVRHDRTYDIDRGVTALRITDVAALIDPTTVTFSSLDKPDTRVVEQSFQFDLVSQEKLLQRYLGQKITVEQPRGDLVDLVEGTLLGIGDGLTLQMDDGSVRAVRVYGNLQFSQLPGGLNTRPTLEWLLDSPSGGEQKTRIAYETQGMTWWADYNIILDEATGCSMDLSSWVSIINQSGAGYRNARLKLIAGDVNRAAPAPVQREMMFRTAVAEDSAGFAEKAFFEYHLYTLGRRTDLRDNSTRQIQLMPTANGVQCEKELVFAPTLSYPWYGALQLDQEYGRYGQSDVNVYLRFANEKNSRLGMPLPAGRVRVNQLDSADGSLEFIGEDVVGHTPRNEDVLIRMGNAFDIVGERTQTDFQLDSRSRNLMETIEIRLRNHKPEAVDLIVLENLYRWSNWQIENPSVPFEKESSNRIRFKVRISGEGEAVIRYTAHYMW